MSWKCMFGSHKYEVTMRIKQSRIDEDNQPVGYDTYVIKKCERCSKELGLKTDYYWCDTKIISPDYICTVYGKESKE